MPGPEPPSPFFCEQRQALREAARHGPILDLACGRGRHARPLVAEGLPVVALDRRGEALRELVAAAGRGPLHALQADLEQGHAIPLADGSCGGVLVFRYLWRPLAAEIQRVLRPAGLLLYETFTLHQRELGHGPRNTAFLLQEGELPRLFPDLRVEACWEGVTPGARPEALARLRARRPR